MRSHGRAGMRSEKLGYGMVMSRGGNAEELNGEVKRCNGNDKWSYAVAPFGKVP